MKGTLVVTFLLCLSLIQGIRAVEPVILDSENFEKFLADQGKTFVKFYAPWCGFCKKIAPTWDELANALDGQVNIAKVDCTVGENRNLCHTFEVSGYPTLKIIKYEEGQLYETEYKGDRSLADLKQFALKTQPSKLVEKKGSIKNERKASGEPKEKPKHEWNPNSSVVKITEENLNNITQGVWLIDFYADWCPHCQELIPVYEETASQLKGQVNVAKVNMEDGRFASALMRLLGVDRLPTLRFFRDGQVYNVTYSHPATTKQLVDFVNNQWKKAEHAPIPDLKRLPEFYGLDESPPLSFIEEFAATYPTELGMVAAFILFALGFILGRITAVATPPPQTRSGTTTKKQQ